MPFLTFSAGQGLRVALVLSLAAAVSLGITRFAYGMLLPPMRADLGWTYTVAGAMNTANAVGYLLGALSAPWLMRRLTAPHVLVGGTLLAGAFMAASGFFTEASALMLQRLLAGVASAWVFVAGGVLAARLSTWYPRHSGLLLGIFYGGVGWGIVLSAVAVPAILQSHAHEPHGWQWVWWWLALVCAGITVALVWPARFFIKKESLSLSQQVNEAIKVDVSAKHATTAAAPAQPAAAHVAQVPLSALGFALAGYTCFGVGYIGYMTFVIALLRDQGVSVGNITVFYGLLGLSVVASSRLWAGLLDRARGGGALALLNALLGVATVLPALTTVWPLMLLSGALFGGVFLSVVASTTALVRHNLPVAQWPAGISAFTVVFAAGQIVGPSVVGWIADGEGGLTRGLLVSAVALWAGAALAWRQQPLHT
ncbi:MAG: YbfB/YjiJ family MFS transporter [Burkholderiales bacterium]|nr:YbfB/YjiJ family MFS transporter [Burkholderiales bacterium]